MAADAPFRIALSLAVVLCCPGLLAAKVLTGEVQSVDAQSVFTPPSNSSPVVLRYYAPEGARVEKGQVVLRIDAGQSAVQVRDLASQIQQLKANVAKEIAGLEVKRVDAELALVDAEAGVAVARIDAELPRELVSGLDYDRYQGELQRALREAELKRKELGEARAAVARSREDGELQIGHLTMRRDYHAGQVAIAEVRAERDGVLVHGFDPRSGSRFDEGSTSWPGNKVGEIVSDGGRQRVRAWALEPDRAGLEVGQRVDLRFDALPGQASEGRITHISGVPEVKPEWGEGRYFVIDIEFSGAVPVDAPLPGMSVRVMPRARGKADGRGK